MSSTTVSDRPGTGWAAEPRRRRAMRCAGSQTRMFTPGEEYRRPQILQFVGSRQQQTGIIWGPAQPGAVVVTSGGKHGREGGYQDQRRPDGSWLYYGQGSRGHQKMDSFANRLLMDGRRSVLLFSTREPTPVEVRAAGSHAKMYRYEGAFVVCSWEYEEEPSGPRRGERVIRFDLRPALAPAVLAVLSGPPEPTSMSFTELRRRVQEEGRGAALRTITLAEYIARSERVRQYALIRASGNCELCGAVAPFRVLGGAAFLEVHHLFRLADGGPDEPGNVAALCPNCHRAVHLALDARDRNDLLIGLVQRKEAELDGRA